jgi:uncharacterized protein (DUF305 family)
MKRSSRPPMAARALVAGVAAACALAAPARAQQAPTPANAADAQFMSGMLMHHAQAVVMGDWAPSHGASKDVALLCRRIAISQRDEIKTMANWLSQHGLPVPDTNIVMGDTLPGAPQPMLMQGMLTGDQLVELRAAQGPAFDRLFLEDMIYHHTGAVVMVNDLLKAPGAAQDPLVYELANEISAGQLVEIHRMQALLATLSLGTH